MNLFADSQGVVVEPMIIKGMKNQTSDRIKN